MLAEYGALSPRISDVTHVMKRVAEKHGKRCARRRCENLPEGDFL